MYARALAKHHLARLLKARHGARDFLEQGGYLGAKTVPQLETAFQRRFAVAQLGRSATATPGAEDADSDEESDDTEVWL